MRSWRTCSYEDMLTVDGLEEELNYMKEDIKLRSSRIIYSKFSQNEFPRIEEISIQMRRMAKSHKNISKFWCDTIHQIETALTVMERRLSKGNFKGGIKSRENREKRREKAWEKTEEEYYNMKKEDKKVVKDSNSNKRNWDKE